MSWLNQNTYRLYNGAVATLVLIDFLRNPEGFAGEYILDIAIHGMAAIFPNADHEMQIGFNLARMGHASFGLLTGYSSIPNIFNALDIANHGMNVAYNMYKRKQEPALSKQAEQDMSMEQSLPACCRDNKLR